MLAKMEANQETMDAKIDADQEKLGAAVYSIRSELEETVKHWVEDFLLCVDQKTHLDLEAVKGDITDTNKAIQDTRNSLHIELDIMFQV
jgi:hypothetical protein